MADTKTSDEAAATTPTGAELVRIVQSATSKKTTVAVLSHHFRGARARMNADDTAQNVTASDVAITFDVADFDTDSFWSAGSPTRLTIPSGVSYVMLSGQALVSSSTGDTFYSVSIQHRNSANTLLRYYGQRFMEGGNTSRMCNVSSGAIAVSSGDYFTLNVREESDNSVTIEGDDSAQTFLALTVLGMTP